MKKSFLSLMVGLLFVPATSVIAEDIYFDGSIPGMQSNDPVQNVPGSLFPTTSLTGNNVTVNAPGYTINGFVFGGVTAGSGEVSGNNLVIHDGTFDDDVFGGYSVNGRAANNTVTVDGGSFHAVGHSVFGGYSETGITENNRVILNNGASISSGVNGGFSTGGTVKNNEVIITGARASTVYGGRSENGLVENNRITFQENAYSGASLTGGRSTHGTVTQNEVMITDSEFYSAQGGISDNGDAIGNSVTVINSVNRSGAGSNITGGSSSGTSGRVENNTVKVINSRATRIYGGINNDNGTVSGNTVTVTDSTVSSLVYGAYASSGTATGNTVTIEGNTVVNGTVAGAVTQTGTATNNTVNLLGGTINGSVWGGRATGSGGDVFTGNTLNVVNRFTLTGLSNFENLNFTLPVDMQANSSDAVITAGTVDLGGASTVKSIHIAPGTTPFTAGDTINLISSGSPITGNLANTTVQSKQGLSLLYDWDLDLNANVLTASLSNTTLNPQSRNLLLGRLDEMALLKQGGDLLSGIAIENMVASAKAGNKGFIAIQGGHSKYKTDPDFDLDSFTAMGGASWGTTLASGYDLAGGAFVEAGFGNYQSSTDFTEVGAISANGNANYFGGGLLGEMNFNNGFSIDGAFRIGRIKSDWKSDFYQEGQRATYDNTSSLYLGAHIGAAYKWAISQQDSLNTYARYSWAHIDSDKVNVLGDEYTFDSVTSSRIRIGTKYARNNSSFMPYAGIAYEYEFDGKEGGSVYGFRLKDLDLGGSTVIAELGVSWLPTNDDNLRLNAALEGFAGNREGVMASMRLNYRF